MKTFDKVLFNIAFVLFVIGLGGLGGACDGHGSFMLSAIIFSIGVGLGWYETKKGTESE